MDYGKMVACCCVRLDVPLSSWAEPAYWALQVLERNAINMNANYHSKVSVGVQKIKLETNFLHVEVKAYRNS